MGGIEGDEMPRSKAPGLGRNQVVGKITFPSLAFCQSVLDGLSTFEQKTVAVQQAFDQIQKLVSWNGKGTPQDPKKLADDDIADQYDFRGFKSFLNSLHCLRVLLLVVPRNQPNENIGVERNHRLERETAAAWIASSISLIDTGEAFAYWAKQPARPSSRFALGAFWI